ncbi:hypothetical protein PPL_00443 [Heterostelium album PN500]|uniref:Uncharacterized protein n=1 Tax=Heterostelium pallidum (strain ATCC 26659 / Pp 5 / PN500) TaxID=670386 RepID=D3AWG9_HETP5|nr:hypothetical protein PPL_00443 [Heterostelium album PN500]EFA86642.1 hypothetical protein PPL_00443 [Heterostelium album PN500]|eukprot:XP_020438747.1 hypothetical protein PPL_00443 [Heterostelium album PN500]
MYNILQRANKSLPLLNSSCNVGGGSSYSLFQSDILVNRNIISLRYYSSYSKTNRYNSNINNKYTYNTTNNSSSSSSSSSSKSKKKRLDDDLNWENVKIHTSLDPETLMELHKENQSTSIKSKINSRAERVDRTVDEMMNSKGGNVNKMIEQLEDDSDQSLKEPIKKKTFIRESYTYIPTTKNDEKFINDALKSDEFNEEITEESGWQEWDYGKKGVKTYDEEKTRKQDAAKHGLSLKDDGLLYFEKFAIPPQFESYFTNPNAPTNRTEKKYFRRLDEKLLASKESNPDDRIEKRKKQRKTVIDEDSEEHTVLQKKFSERILDLLNDSFLFDDNDGVVVNKSPMTPTFFKNKEQQEMEQLDSDEIVDPILAKANISLTKAKMSSDLRWVKVYWTRENTVDEQNKDNNDNNDMIEQYHKYQKNQDKIIQLMNDSNINNDNNNDSSNNNNNEKEEFNQLEESTTTTTEEYEIQDIISELSTTGAKKLILRKHKQDIPQPSIKTSSTLHKNNMVNVVGVKDTDGKSDASSINPEFSFGASNVVAASFEKVQLNVSIPTLHESLMEPTKMESLAANDNNEQDDEKSMEIDLHDELLELENQSMLQQQQAKKNRYEKVTDEQINARLVAHTPRLRLLISKNIKTRYVPNIYFLKDKQQRKMDVAIDLYDAVVVPELLRAANATKSLQSRRSEQLKNRFMGIFNDKSQSTNNNSNNNDEVDQADDMYMDESFANEILKEESELENIYTPVNIFTKKSTKSNNVYKTDLPIDNNNIDEQQATINHNNNDNTSDVKQHTNIDKIKSRFKDFNKSQF